MSQRSVVLESQSIWKVSGSIWQGSSYRLLLHKTLCWQPLSCRVLPRGPNSKRPRTPPKHLQLELCQWVNPMGTPSSPPDFAAPAGQRGKPTGSPLAHLAVCCACWAAG